MSYYVPPVERRRTSPIGNAIAGMGESIARGMERNAERQAQAAKEQAASAAAAQAARNNNLARGMIEGPAPTRPGMFSVPGIGPMQQPQTPGPIGQAFSEGPAQSQPGMPSMQPPQLQMPPSLQGAERPVHRAFTQEADPDFYKHEDASGTWHAPTPQAQARAVEQRKQEERMATYRAEYASLTGQRMPDVGSAEEAAQAVGEAKHAWNTRERTQASQMTPYQQHQISRQERQDTVRRRTAVLVGSITKNMGDSPDYAEVLAEVNRGLTPRDRELGITAQQVLAEVGLKPGAAAASAGGRSVDPRVLYEQATAAAAKEIGGGRPSPGQIRRAWDTSPARTDFLLQNGPERTAQLDSMFGKFQQTADSLKNAATSGSQTPANTRRR
jgi:hypothetical protein